MHFCNNCDNMLYIKLKENESNDLVYYCRNCGNSDVPINAENICVCKTDIVTTERGYLHDINEYTKLDPTLPRTNKIRCPNQSCASHTKKDDNDSKNEVIYFRYDDNSLKYIYICTICDKMWKTSEE